MVDASDEQGEFSGSAMVTFALPERHFICRVPIESGMTVALAIERSGILADAGLPPAALAQDLRVGIYGKVCSLDTLVRNCDRIELYRPLIADPKEARRRRAAHRTRPASSNRGAKA